MLRKPEFKECMLGGWELLERAWPGGSLVGVVGLLHTTVIESVSDQG